MLRTPEDTLKSFVLLPDLVLERVKWVNQGALELHCSKCSVFEVCPKCATPSRSVYDRRVIRPKDEPIRGKTVFLVITKRRFRCPACRAVFTEPISGVAKRRRFTSRFFRSICWAADRFSSMSALRRSYRCSPATCLKVVNFERRRRLKARSYPFPKAIGLDEHSIRKPKYKDVQFATIVVDHSNQRVFDLVDGRQPNDLQSAFGHRKSRKNVRWVTLDLSPSFKAAAKRLFSNASLVADRFHVQRLFNRRLNKARLKVTGDDRKNPIRKLLMRNASELQPFERRAMLKWLSLHPEVREAWTFKEAMRAVYRIKGYKRAKAAFRVLLDQMGHSKSRTFRALRKTLRDWAEEILAYHKCKLSNGRTEGFNRKAKLYQRGGYGIRSFESYRLKLLNGCF